MAGPGVIIQSLRHPGLKRVSMNITNKLKEISIGFDKESLIPPPE